MAGDSRYWSAFVIILGFAGLAAGCGGVLDAIFEGSSPPGSDSISIASMEEPNGFSCTYVANGCGPQGMLGVLVPDCPMGLACFTSACNDHDVCYRTCGSVKSDCDALFLQELTAGCHNRYAESDPKLARCVELASVYVRAVELFAHSAFETDQYRGCFCSASEPEAGLPVRVSEGVSIVDYADADGDLLPDEWEIAVGLDPTDPSDRDEDFDSDGLINLEEFIHETDPFSGDSDGDGIPDGLEALRAQPIRVSEQK